jgi:hypothetical protein
MRPPSDRKSPRPVSRRGLWNSCDDEDMPVICPTCQIFCGTVAYAPALLFKPLDRRRGFCGNDFGCFGNWRRGFCSNRFDRLGNWQRSCPGGRLLLGSDAGLCCTPRARARRGMPYTPGMRDRGSCGISDQRTCHRAHRSQNDRARHRAQGSASSTILSSCLE